jgi:hypothetical protein
MIKQGRRSTSQGGSSTEFSALSNPLPDHLERVSQLTQPARHSTVMANWLNITRGRSDRRRLPDVQLVGDGQVGGQQIAGLRVVDRGGQRLSLWRSFARAVLYVLLPAGSLSILASRRNASLQDLIVGTAVVYDRAYHPADEAHPTDHGHSPGPAPST